MDQETTWYELGLCSGDIVLDGDPAAPPPRKGAQQPPIFRPMSIAAKRSLISATAELLFTFYVEFYVFVTSEVRELKFGWLLGWLAGWL